MDNECILKANKSLKNILDTAKRFYHSGSGGRLGVGREKSFATKPINIDHARRSGVEFKLKKYKGSRDLKSKFFIF